MTQFIELAKLVILRTNYFWRFVTEEKEVSEIQLLCYCLECGPNEGYKHQLQVNLEADTKENLEQEHLLDEARETFQCCNPVAGCISTLALVPALRSVGLQPAPAAVAELIRDFDSFWMRKPGTI